MIRQRSKAKGARRRPIRPIVGKRFYSRASVNSLVRHCDVYREAANSSRGRLRLGAVYVPCALGRAGIQSQKKEGDGATPFGTFGMIGLLMRRARFAVRAPGRPVAPIRSSDGWCDDPASGAYNRRVRLPHRAGCEKLWRDDGLYDVILVLDYNLAPRRKGRGSAIFFHLARSGFEATEGCVAISASDMRRLLPRLSPSARLAIHLPGGGCARPEDRRPHPDMGRAALDGQFKIRAHAHRQAGKAIASCNGRQKRKMR